ncbi:16915_t:CDS:1, partial [Racocetra fulgida]
VYLESNRFLKWSSRDLKDHVLNESGVDYSDEEISKATCRELRCKMNDCNLYRAATQKAATLLNEFGDVSDDAD